MLEELKREADLEETMKQDQNYRVKYCQKEKKL
jgi:hypothetical protein